MERRLFHLLFAFGILFSLAACQHYEPNPIKPAEERKVLLVNGIADIYDLSGETVTTLPDCKSISQIILEGSDYFVAGSNTKGRVGYWKNGKWNTLHVDFKDEVDSKIYGIAKWDCYIYLLKNKYVLKNSGIFRLKDADNFTPARHGISAAGGACYVVGDELVETPVRARVPVMYYEHKGEYVSERLALPDGVHSGEAHGVFAYGDKHVLVGGFVGREPAIWVDKQLQILPRSFDVNRDFTTSFNGTVDAVTYIDGHNYALGSEYYDEEHQIATVWCDGVPKYHLKSTDDNFVSSEVMDIQAYGNDLYVLTMEYTLVDKGDYSYEMMSSVLWMNDKVLGVIKYKGMISFAVY
ncbi:MAG: hypothetical protein J6X70_07160 [Muribaculaceae bacterium]|nr:hypothetical protein [Muribaculaceae bacterium]